MEILLLQDALEVKGRLLPYPLYELVQENGINYLYDKISMSGSYREEMQYTTLCYIANDKIKEEFGGRVKDLNAVKTGKLLSKK